MRLGLIGNGAIAGFVSRTMTQRGHQIAAHLLRPERVEALQAVDGGPVFVSSVQDLPHDLDHLVDCAGHSALREYGAEILRAGFDLTTVSIGALADRALEVNLTQAAIAGGSKLLLVSGAIGGLDALRAARAGDLRRVRYTGRKPPKGWIGSVAETRLDLHHLEGVAQTHFLGTAREAALEYPKNANVAAAVALSGLGFEATEVELIADPGVAGNIHEVLAEGDFGQFTFRIAGNALPENPRSSALAAMSIISTLEQHISPIRF
ncbi:MAG: aspartate dehydrogenase [Pseudodonghicola sp.]|nr:aspartate dehydrogenase [Pseudodonghicola sp.]